MTVLALIFAASALVVAAVAFIVAVIALDEARPEEAAAAPVREKPEAGPFLSGPALQPPPPAPDHPAALDPYAADEAASDAIDVPVIDRRTGEPLPALEETAGTGAAAPAPPASPSPRAHGGGKQGPAEATRDLAVKAKELLAARGPLPVGDLREALGLNVKGFAKVRALLNQDPDVLTSGATRARRYQLRNGAPTPAQRQRIAAEATGGLAPGRAKGMPTSAGPKGAARQQPLAEGRVMAAIQLLPKTAIEIAKDIDEPINDVLDVLRNLEANGDVRKDFKRNTWKAVL